MSEDIHNARVNIEKDKARGRGFFASRETRLKDTQTHLTTILDYFRTAKNHSTGQPLHRVIVSTHKNMKLDGENLEERESLAWAGVKGAVNTGGRWGAKAAFAGAVPELIPLMLAAHSPYPYYYPYTGIPGAPTITGRVITAGAAGAMGLGLGSVVGAYSGVRDARRRNAQELFKKGDRVSVNGRTGILKRHEKETGRSSVTFDDNKKSRFFNPMVDSSKLRKIQNDNV